MLHVIFLISKVTKILSHSPWIYVNWTFPAGHRGDMNFAKLDIPLPKRLGGWQGPGWEIANVQSGWGWGYRAGYLLLVMLVTWSLQSSPPPETREIGSIKQGFDYEMLARPPIYQLVRSDIIISIILPSSAPSSPSPFPIRLLLLLLLLLNFQVRESYMSGCCQVNNRNNN